MVQSDQRESLGVDIGGTGIKGATVDTGSGRLTSKIVYLPTQPATPVNIAGAVLRITKELDWSGAIGCGYPGVVKNGIAQTAVHLSKEWLNQNISGVIGEVIGASVTALNDADAAGIAEMKFGAGQGHIRNGIVLVVTLGTGIGSALFVDGRLVPNTEFGHVYIEGVEAEETAAAIKRTTENLSWEVWGGRVNRFLAEMEKLLSPDLIIVGGGVSENFGEFKAYLRARARVVPAALGNTAGIIGAAVFALEPTP